MPARKIEAQTSKLEAVDTSIDPLGPLGNTTTPSTESSIPELAPTPPRKETAASRNVRPLSSASQQSGFQSPGASGLSEDGNISGISQRGPPPVQPPSAGSIRQTQPSMSLEQAAKPTFDILVGDPHKVGDLTSSHIVYQVRTKVGRSSTPACWKLKSCRQPRKHTDNLNLLSRDDIVISCGYTTPYTTTILGLWFHLHQRSKLWEDLILNLLNLEDRRWNGC